MYLIRKGGTGVNLNLLESLFYGLVSGLSEILPVSGPAHRNLMLQLLGESGEQGLLRLMIHIGILAALYYSCQNHILRMIRAQKLARVPKRKRRRPLDVRSLMDLSLLKTMAIPVILALLVYSRASTLASKRILMSILLFINGIILYVPQFLPSSNRDSRTLSRVEGICMGLGGALSVIPGFSATGMIASVGSVCGVDKAYGLSMTLLLNMVLIAGQIVYDFFAIVSAGLAGVTFLAILGYIVAGFAAFAGAYVSIRLLRALLKDRSLGVFAFYCWGLSLLTFILYLST